jgi:predicted PurR-regulated permease PerM
MGAASLAGSGADPGPSPGDPLTRIGRFLAVCAAIAAAVWFLYRIKTVILIVLAGVGLAYAFEPIVAALSAGRPRFRPLSITVAYVLTFLCVASAGVLGLRPVAEDIRAFAAALPGYVERVDAEINAASRDLRRLVPPELRPKEEDVAPGKAILSRIESLVPNLGQYTTGLLTMGQFVVELATGAAIAFVISVYVISDPSYLRTQLLRVLPSSLHADMNLLWDEIDDVLSAYVRGQVFIAVAVGLIATLGLRVIGVKYALVLGLFTTLTQLVPQVGPAIGLIAAVLLASLQRPASALAVLVLYAVLYEFSGHVLAPWIMGKAVKLRPMVVLLATMVGTVLAGVPGLLFSVPAAAVVKVLWNFFYARLAPRWGLGDAPALDVMPSVAEPGPGGAALAQGRS